MTVYVVIWYNDQVSDEVLAIFDNPASAEQLIKTRVEQDMKDRKSPHYDYWLRYYQVETFEVQS